MNIVKMFCDKYVYTKLNMSLKKLQQSDAVFAGLTRRILDQSHIHHHFQLVEEDGTPCTTPATAEARLRTLVAQENPSSKQHCTVTVISTHCVEKGCPNVGKIIQKRLNNIIAFRADGTVHTRVWCDYCKQSELFDDIIPRLLEKHPKKHFVLLHPVTKAECTDYTDIMAALHAYGSLQSTKPTHFKVFAKSTHVMEGEGGCACSEFVKEYALHSIAFHGPDGPAARVWSKQCAEKTISKDKKVLYPKGHHTVGNIESTRQNMLAQMKELNDLSICIDNIQQCRVYDVLIRKTSDTLGAAVQLASGRRSTNNGSANLQKTMNQLINVLESRALFIGQEMSRDGEKLLRILVLPPSALQRVRDITAKYLYFNGRIVEKFKEFVFDCDQPDQMQKMAQLIEAHIANPTSLRMDLRSANAHTDSFNTFLEHVGVEAILQNHYEDKSAGIRIFDDCQGDFVAFQKVHEIKTLRLQGNLYRTSIKPMDGVDNLICLVLADGVRVKAKLLFDTLQDRRLQMLPCDDLILDLNNFLNGHIIDGVFKFVDPVKSVRTCPKDKPLVSFSMSHIDGKVVHNPIFMHDMTKASYIDTRNVPNRELLALIFN